MSDDLHEKAVRVRLDALFQGAILWVLLCFLFLGEGDQQWL